MSIKVCRSLLHCIYFINHWRAHKVRQSDMTMVPENYTLCPKYKYDDVRFVAGFELGT